MSVRRVAVALVALGALAACSLGGRSTTSDPTGPGTGTIGGASATPTPETTPPAPAALTCQSVRNAAVGTVALPLASYGAAAITLHNGQFTDSDGTLVELLPACATGDISGDGVTDVVAGVRHDPDGTGTFYDLVVWLGTTAGTPALGGSEDLGDRNPIKSIAISGGVVTAVYFTRTAEVPMAGLNVQRTATYTFAMPGLTETGHVDVSCGPCNP